MARKYYDGSKVLSYGKEFIFSVGNRSAGKSFFWKVFSVKRFLNHGEQFLYVRRYDNELDSVSGFFGDIQFVFPDVDFLVKGRKFYINGEYAGQAIALSLAYKVKSSTFVDVTTIFYDEFLPENNRYLKNEYNMALNLYQTVARGGGEMVRAGVRFVFVANHVSLYNPYFSGIGARIMPDSKYIKGDGWVVEIFQNDSVKDEILKLGGVSKLLLEGEYGQYANQGKFLLDNDAFIEKMEEKGSRYVLTIRYDGQEFGVYQFSDHFHISSKVKKDFPYRYTFSNDDHRLDYVLISQWRNDPIMVQLKLFYENSKVLFTSQKAKNMFLEVLNYTD